MQWNLMKLVIELPIRDGNDDIINSFPGETNGYWTSYKGWKLDIEQLKTEKIAGYWTSYKGWKLHIVLQHLQVFFQLLNFL